MYLPIFLTSIISQQFKDELIIEQSADIWYRIPQQTHVLLHSKWILGNYWVSQKFSHIVELYTHWRKYVHLRHNGVKNFSNSHLISPDFLRSFLLIQEQISILKIRQI